MHGVVFNRLQDLRIKGGAHAERNLSHGKCRVFFKVSMKPKREGCRGLPRCPVIGLR